MCMTVCKTPRPTRVVCSPDLVPLPKLRNVCVYVCMYECMYVRMYVWMYVCIAVRKTERQIGLSVHVCV